MPTPMGAAIAKPNVTSDENAWSPAVNPAVAAILDIVAEELALEYVRLMEAAAVRDARFVGGSASEARAK